MGIPTVLDRLIQQAIAQELTPIFDPTFLDSSFGFRPGRAPHDAVYQVREIIRKGYRIAVNLDLSKFFDTVDHNVLQLRLAPKVRDKRVLRLIVQRLLERTLKLQINQEKSRVAPTDQATISTAMSRKGPWRLARTLATQAGVSE